MFDHSEAERLITECLNEFMEFLLENPVNSVHLKKAKDCMTDLRTMIATSKSSPNLPAQNRPPLQTKSYTRKSIEPDENKEASLKLAYGLSKYDVNIINNIFGTNLIQNEALEMVSGILNTNKTTLRNYRDYYDRHVQQVYSNRKGWDVPLPPQMQHFKDLLDDKSETELMAEIRDVLESVAPDINLLVRVSYGFLFGKKGVRSNFTHNYSGYDFDVVNAPHEDGNQIAYMVFTGFGNSLTRGIYPGIYVYRKINKIFTVFGESVSTPAEHKWSTSTHEFKSIRDGLSTSELAAINSYRYTYLTNRYFNCYEYDVAMNPNDKIALAQNIIDDTKFILDKYIAQYQPGEN